MNNTQQNKTNTCFIFGARPVLASLAQEALQLYEENPFVVAADAGALQAENCGLMPDVVLGDFDSAPHLHSRAKAAQANQKYHTVWMVLPKEKDDTDLHYAAKETVRLGFKKALLFGVLGGRFDHSLATLATLLFLQESGVQAIILEETTTVYCVLPGQELTVDKKEDSYLSIFSAKGKSEGVFAKGLQYSMENACLSADFPLGVSNEFKDAQACIACETGALFVMVVKKDADML